MIALALLVGCQKEPATTAAPPPSRVDAVAATAPKERSLDEFCERHDAPEVAKTLTWPELDGQPTPAPASTWTWVNVWATWCGPCVAEMPMLGKWKDQLAAEGTPIDLRFLSVDAQAADVEKFKASHPGYDTGVRVKEYGLLPGWLGAVGLDASAVIPIHLFVDPQQKIRCVRLGAIEPADYSTVKRVLAGG